MTKENYINLLDLLSMYEVELIKGKNTYDISTREGWLAKLEYERFLNSIKLLKELICYEF